ncbi:MAG: hypothetical protein HW397_498 [Dehalococcoidia bacterium]|nr:hypothetical protein [Dehalococcoidia bacterium]
MTALDLPLELQPFFPQIPQGLPPSVLATIREGWEKMLPIGRLRLLQRLEREKSQTLRVLVADLAAAKVLLGVAERPARELADNMLLMGTKKPRVPHPDQQAIAGWRPGATLPTGLRPLAE